MNDTFWVMLFRPFFALAVMAFICIPVRLLAQRLIPEGKIKKILLKDLRRNKRSQLLPIPPRIDDANSSGPRIRGDSTRNV